MKKLLVGMASTILVALPAPASATATITFGSTTSIPNDNDFKTDLANLGFTEYAAAGSNIVLNSSSIVTFYFLGSESGFSDTFQTTNALPNVSLTEHSSIENHFSLPIVIGSDTFPAGTLVNDLLFTNNGGSAGLNAAVGDAGFGIFLPRTFQSGSSTDTFYFGYDDQAYRPDKDFDDFIVKAVISPVPEPKTWAMMMLGFGAIGFAARRQKTTARGLQFA